MTVPDRVDALVVGGGPAGLAAATWLGRYQRRSLVVDAGQRRNRVARQVHGYLARDPVDPQLFVAEARTGVDRYPTVARHHGRVEQLRRLDKDEFAAVVDGTELRARRIVLATGVRDRFPRVEGFDAHYGTDVFHCVGCDGYETRDRAVVVLGSGSQVPAFASQLLNWAAQVRVVTDRADPVFTDDQRDACSSHGIEVVDGSAVALVGEPGALEGVRLADGTVVPGALAFFSYKHQPTNDLARQLGCELDGEGFVVVDDFQLTTVDGVYAAGDVVPGMQFVAVAAGRGTVAGVACATSLHGHRTVPESPAAAPPPRRFARG